MGYDGGKGKGKGGGWGAWAPMMAAWDSWAPWGWGKGMGKGMKGKDNVAKQTPPSQKVFVGGLPELGSEGLSIDLNKKLKEHFNQCGKCKFAEIGRKGTGVACFFDRETATKAVTELNGSVFDGNHVLEVKEWGKGAPKTE
eukprot:TRINITY_DN221_c0_g2_i1.p1 TRINITY_DN221_c0_g2~~TRINITY_DN221_c0_g2_i1.p1  ORF type:complete len:141 (-),score=56.64 TRINITY_DN221_c0_g2_i1:108-530(-)